MKITDLQIGDWVFFYAGFDKEESCNSPVSGILATNILYSKDDIFLEFCGGDPFHGDELFPILITPEVLERNGFDKEKWTTSSWKRILGGYDHWCDMSRSDGKWYLRIKDDGMFSCMTTVKYVHELQHVFRLFNIEQDWKIEETDDPDWDLINKED